ncbi:hypothetical protein M885DRAFT_321699 [Pelagophyceae sp. CCMP2097]|nr:hypothetical protein M885DRAFT_321699 [Pelagophyceae sp. CCMP2097]
MFQNGPLKRPFSRGLVRPPRSTVSSTASLNRLGRPSREARGPSNGPSPNGVSKGRFPFGSATGPFREPLEAWRRKAPFLTGRTPWCLWVFIAWPLGRNLVVTSDLDRDRARLARKRADRFRPVPAVRVDWFESPAFPAPRFRHRVSGTGFPGPVNFQSAVPRFEPLRRGDGASKDPLQPIRRDAAARPPRKNGASGPFPQRLKRGSSPGSSGGGQVAAARWLATARRNGPREGRSKRSLFETAPFRNGPFPKRPLFETVPFRNGPFSKRPLSETVPFRNGPFSRAPSRGPLLEGRSFSAALKKARPVLFRRPLLNGLDASRASETAPLETVS